MNLKTNFQVAGLLAALALCPTAASAAKNNKKAEPQIQLNEAGKQLEAKYTAILSTLKAEITQALPVVSEQKRAALQKAQAAVASTQKESGSAAEAAGEIGKMQGVIANWKSGVGWMGRAKKKIAQAQADLAAATTDAARQAAQKALAAAQADLAACEQRIKETEAKIAEAKAGQGARASAKATADAALAAAKKAQANAAKAIFSDLEPLWANDKLEPKLVKAVVLMEATPKGLAEFAQKDKQHEALVDTLLANEKLMKEMLIAGGASGGKYGQAMHIYTAIQQASSKAKEGPLQRLALATSVELAVPIKQTNAETAKNAPDTVDPVNRYLHYEKAYLNGELDPAFKDFDTWEYRLVVDCNAPDEILAWGREMLRTYRPDHIFNPNYGWRYSAAVKTEVPYGSQCVKDDLPSLNQYQNIPKDGGVCGRRAFFGRFILRSFGIPVWGVTQHAHAALSHWTPKGWVVNLGAGFEHSWWDKDDAPMSGHDFLLETQARENASEFMKVLRARWISRIQGEQAYNGRKGVTGGFWSSLAHNYSIMLASHAVGLGPLGQELAEANEPQEKMAIELEPVKPSDQQVVVKDGAITIPSVAHAKPSGPVMTTKSFSGGMQIHCGAGSKLQYAFEAPKAGKYAITAKLATLQEKQTLVLAANSAKPAEVPAPYTIGLWKQAPLAEVSLVQGRNVLNVELPQGMRGVTIKEFTLRPL